MWHLGSGNIDWENRKCSGVTDCMQICHDSIQEDICNRTPSPSIHIGGSNFVNIWIVSK